MKFIIEPAVFEKLPTACFGVVAAKGIDNSRHYEAVDALLDQGIALAESRFAGRKVKEEPDILPYRAAFQALGVNPNKYMCSIEALFTRIAKGKGMSRINPLVDLNNALSLKYTLPMGTHDLGASPLDIEVRFAREGDTFLPFGGGTPETPDSGELVYAVGSEVRTRRWTWRQSEQGKIGPGTSYVFFPIDGFTDFNRGRVLEARDELAGLAEALFGCQARTGFLDRDCREMDLSL
nr:phenylalanine--tRNA ligase beta subunit-related protein [uncultured Oscillibacter sp.]